MINQQWIDTLKQPGATQTKTLSQIYEERKKQKDIQKYGTGLSGKVAKASDTFLGATADIFKGIGKSAANTFLGMSSLGERYILNPLTGQKTTQTSAEKLKNTLPAGTLENRNGFQTAGGILFDVATFLNPTSKVAQASKYLGGLTKARTGSSFLGGLTKIGTGAVGEGLTAAGLQATKEGKLNKNVATAGLIGAVVPAGLSTLGATSRLADRVVRYSATKASGLSRSVVDDIVSGNIPAAAMKDMDRLSLGNRVKNVLLDERASLRSSGRQYNTFKDGAEGVANVNKGTFKNILDSYGLKEVDGKLVADANTRPMSDVDLKSINNWFKTYTDETGGKMTANQFLNSRSSLSEIARFDKLGTTGKTLNGQNLAKELRAELNKQADNFVANGKKLSEIDAEYSPKKQDLDSVIGKILKDDGELKDNAYSIIANLDKESKTSVLTSLKKYIPDIDQQVKVLRAVEDIARASEQKVGAYFSNIFAGGGQLMAMATGNPAFALTLLANPKFIVPVLRAYGTMTRIGSGIIDGIINKLLGGKTLTNTEKEIVADTIEAVNNKKLLTSPKQFKLLGTSPLRERGMNMKPLNPQTINKYQKPLQKKANISKIKTIKK